MGQFTLPLEEHSLKVANSAFCPYFFNDIFEKKEVKNPLSLLQVSFRFHNNENFNTTTMLIVRKETQKKPRVYMYKTKNHDLWKSFVTTNGSKFYENCWPKKLPNEILNSENLGQFSKPTPKIETNGFYEKMKTTQH